LQTRNTRFYYWAKVQHFGETAKEFGKNVSVGPQKTTKFLINGKKQGDQNKKTSSLLMESKKHLILQAKKHTT